MDLYDLTIWGFIVTVVSVYGLGSWVRNMLTGLANGIDHRLNDLESQIKDLQKDINRIDGKIPKPFDRWGDLSSE